MAHEWHLIFLNIYIIWNGCDIHSFPAIYSKGPLPVGKAIKCRVKIYWSSFRLIIWSHHDSSVSKVNCWHQIFSTNVCDKHFQQQDWKERDCVEYVDVAFVQIQCLFVIHLCRFRLEGTEKQNEFNLSDDCNLFSERYKVILLQDLAFTRRLFHRPRNLIQWTTKFNTYKLRQIMRENPRSFSWNVFLSTNFKFLRERIWTTDIFAFKIWL